MNKIDKLTQTDLLITTRYIDLRGVQRKRKLVISALLLLAVILAAVTDSAADSGLSRHGYIEAFGTALIIFCVVGRTWSSIYIAGSKRSIIVDTGPYSIVRNPLYLFSVTGAAGVGLVSGSIIFGFAFALITFLIFHVVVLSEEAFLQAKFGAKYSCYRTKVRRWHPRLSAWRDSQWIRTRPANILKTFRDSSLFLLAFPVFELIEYFQDVGLLPLLLELP